MIVLAIDPATRRCDRGVALVRDGELLASGHTFVGPLCSSVGSQIDFVAVEAQWFDRTAERDIQKILKLARYAGRLQERARQFWPSAKTIVVPVATWKGALFGPTFANVPKKVFTANLAKLHALRGLTDHNLLDAAGLGLACCKLGREALLQLVEE